MRAIQTSNLSLILLVSLFILSSFVNQLLISDKSHLFWIAVLNIQSELRLEQYIASKIFCHLALILLLKIDEGLLSIRNDLNLSNLTLTSWREVDFKLFFCCSKGKVLNKKAKEHDRLLIFEISHHKLMMSLILFLGFSYI